MPLPYAVPDFPGIGGVIRQRPEDFFVQELPLYEPSGQGEHVYCEIQKIGITTFEAINRLARALGIPSRSIAYAGMKDANAVTRQTLSIHGTTEDAVMAAQLQDMNVLWAIRHTNKLRLGHLAGNRFAVRVRSVTPTDVVKLKPVVAQLQQRGMPNYFGEQRFGRRGDNAKLGEALIRNDDQGLLKLLLGTPDPQIDDEPALAARQAFDEGRYQDALHLLPHGMGMEKYILSRLIKTQKPQAAVGAIDEKIRRLWVSALQSEVFNDVVARRTTSLDRVLTGDLAWKHDSGAVFLVQDSTVEQPRCNAFDISPSGPLIGYRMTAPEGEPLRVEQEILQSHNLAPEHFRVEGRHKVKGARRPLRVKPEDVELAAGVDEHGPHITVAFTLPPGSFATVFLRELMKTDP